LGKVGREQSVRLTRSLIELRPEARLRLDHLVAAGRSALVIGCWVGSETEGAFEIPSVGVWVVGSDGRIERLYLYALDQLDAARARFAELSAESRPDPLRIPPNAASRARDRSDAAFLAGDWDVFRSWIGAPFRYEDRSKRALLDGDVELAIKSYQLIRAVPNVHLARELIATAGDRIAIERVVTTGGPDGSPFEVENLRLSEVDAAGKLLASITFDPDDRRAAFEEAGMRFAATEAGSAALLPGTARAFNERDWETLRSSYSPDAVVHDYRPLVSLGVLTLDEYMESMRVVAEMARDGSVEILRIFASNRLGAVFLSRGFGTVPGGGGPFENHFIGVYVFHGDRICRYELFAADAADAALARFAELTSTA
jgi:hypothetical protein